MRGFIFCVFTLQAVMAVFFPCLSQSATIDWSSTAATSTWGTGLNWDGGSAPANSLDMDIARFNKIIYLSQPNSGTTSINGIQIGDGTTSTAALTLTINALSVGSSGITVFANAGAATLTGGSVKIGANQNWANNSSSLLTISSTVINIGNSTPFILTLNGSGSGGTAISGIVKDGGTSGTTAFTLNTMGGVTTLSGANTFTGGTTLTSGTLQLSGSGTVGGTGGTLTVNGGTLDLNGTSQGVGNFTGSGGTILNNSSGTNVMLTIGNGDGTGGNYSGIITDHTSGTGTISLTKTGNGAITLSGVNTFTGSTTVNAGTLTVATSSGSPLGATTSVTVNSGGTLLLGANDQINNSATVTLAGGTFAKGNFNEGGTGSVGVGALTLTANSHIDFGTGSVGVLTFASLTINSFTLTIDNWTGQYNHQGSGNTDRLIFDSDQLANLNNFYFTGYGAGGVEFALAGGFFEVVAAVPEPSTWATGALALLALGMSYFQRKSARRVTPPAQ
jgi:autotransporter-associated beta strand protein